MAQAPVEISRPTVQFTVDAPHALIQFERRSPRTGLWMKESYHPTQDDWAKRAPAEIQALAAQHPELAGYWSDRQIKEDVFAYLAAEYGITSAVIVGPESPQPDVAVEPTTLEKAAVAQGATL
jgi:hypothetical protein